MINSYKSCREGDGGVERVEEAEETSRSGCADMDGQVWYGWCTKAVLDASTGQRAECFIIIVIVVICRT
jgi:hypothetical protein